MSRILAVAALLCVSGMCALIYQVAWIRELRLVFGGATPAAGAVLAVFMGGLGLGNAILGRFVDRHPNPLRLYGLLELAIAVFAALTPFLIDLTRAIYISFGGQAVLGLTSATLVRLGLTALVLALPTIAMGGTLPAAVRAVTLPNDVQRKSAALVYGLNTVGAVFGVVLSTFWLLEALGTRSTIWAAAIMNGGLAFAALHMSRIFASPRAGFERENSAKVASRKLPRSAEVPASSHLPRGLVYLFAALVGFAFFLMELVWFRMLTPLLGGTTYTFGVILALVLLGIGLGGLLYPLIFRVVRPSGTAFAITCLLEALCMLVPFALGDELAVLAQVLREQTEHSFLSLIGGWAIVSAVVVFPASLISGIQFPVLLALLGRAEENIGKEVGMAVAANTLGAIAGSLLGGFGLLPWLTAPGVWLTVVAMLALLGITTALREAVLAKKKQRALLPVCLCLLAMFLMREPGPTAAWRHSAIGAGRSKFPVDRTPNSLRQWVQWNRSRIQWEADGADASVAISATDDGVSFLVNGKSDGNAISDAATQIMSGVLAAMLHGHPKTGLVIGLGTGESAGWLAEVDSIEKVDVVEIEPIIEQVARECSLANFDVLNHPKVRIHHNDAREHLFTCQDHYDVVFSEPSNPYRVGIASLFTSEFYQAVQQRLNPGGVLVQWLQCYEMSYCQMLWTR